MRLRQGLDHTPPGVFRIGQTAYLFVFAVRPVRKRKVSLIFPLIRKRRNQSRWPGHPSDEAHGPMTWHHRRPDQRRARELGSTSACTVVEGYASGEDQECVSNTV